MTAPASILVKFYTFSDQAEMCGWMRIFVVVLHDCATIPPQAGITPTTSSEERDGAYTRTQSDAPRPLRHRTYRDVIFDHP